MKTKDTFQDVCHYVVRVVPHGCIAEDEIICGKPKDDYRHLEMYNDYSEAHAFVPSPLQRTVATCKGCDPTEPCEVHRCDDAHCACPPKRTEATLDAVQAKLDCYTHVGLNTVCAEILINADDWVRIYDADTRTLRAPLEVSKSDGE